MLADLLGPLIEMVLGNVPQIGLVVTLLYGAHLLGKGKLFATVIDHLRLLIVVMVVGTALGAVEIHPGVVMGLVDALVDLATGLVP